MALYAIGDLHLSLGSNKPMDVFGGRWTNYMDKLAEGLSVLKPEDTCVLCGDVSWGMSLTESLEDFRYMAAMPGRKIILKGNHDYWWSSAAKTQAFFQKEQIENIEILHNNCFLWEDKALCGTRGWFYEEEKGSGHDKKLMDRECMRLEASLKAAGEREKLVFLHYPPIYGDYRCEPILNLLKQYDVRLCVSGHLHAESLRLAFNGWLGCTRFLCVSADAVNFCPVRLDAPAFLSDSDGSMC